MQITSIEIKPSNPYRDFSEENRLKAAVKLTSKETTVETVLNGEDVDELLALVEHIVARAAKRSVGEFVAAVSGNHTQMIEGKDDE